jgi:copper chaperone NosL
MLKQMLISAALGGLLLTGCGGQQIDVSAKPIDPSIDICASCQMSIADAHLAGQIIGAQGQSLKFDDIGCMISYFKKHSDLKKTVQATYVANYQTADWLMVENAIFVKGKLDTPMFSGIVATDEDTAAQQLAERTDGKVLSWEEVQLAHQPHAGGEQIEQH